MAVLRRQDTATRAIHPRILIFDEHAAMRREIRRLLADGIHGVILGEAASGEEVLEICRKQKWDLVVLDVEMRSLGGFDVLDRLKRSRWGPAVLVFSLESRSSYVEQARRFGADGYVSKQAKPHLLLDAVQKISATRLKGRPVARSAGSGR